MASPKPTAKIADRQPRSCKKCGQVKDLSSFEGVRTKAQPTVRFRRVCKECRKEYQKLRYETWPGVREKQVAMARYRSQKVREENRRRLVDYLAEHACVDCGEADVVVLDFDHVEPGKKCDVSVLVSATKNWAEVEEEIAKCVIRCANCHRRKTAREQSWMRWRRRFPGT